MEDLNKSELRRLYVRKGLKQKEIAEKFDLTQGCISKKMDRWNIDSSHKGFWSRNEIQKIRDLYPEEKERLKSEIERSWNAIKLKAIDLGLARDQKEHRNSREVKEHLRSLAEENRIDIDWRKREELSYVLGVIDGDGYTDNQGALGLETTCGEFSEKFSTNLETIGLNPSKGNRRSKNTVWASSKELVRWIESLNYKKKLLWLFSRAEPWMYIEGAYDSDGDFSNSGPRICSYSTEEKEFLKSLLERLGLNPSIHTNNIYIPASGKEKFFENVDPVYEKRRPD